MCSINCFKWASKNINRQDIHEKRIIEVGSHDVNGSLRYVIELLEPKEYIGVNIEKGAGVDIVCPAENLVERFGEYSFDMVISTCVLEHIRDWKIVISNMKKICKKNGIILLIVPSEWHYHGYPHDFWRFSREDIVNIFSDCDILVLDEDDKNNKNRLVYAKIRKPDNFMENVLSEYQLYSIILNKRTTDICDKEIRKYEKAYIKYLRYKKLKRRIKSFVKKIV